MSPDERSTAARTAKAAWAKMDTYPQRLPDERPSSGKHPPLCDSPGCRHITPASELAASTLRRPITNPRSTRGPSFLLFYHEIKTHHGLLSREGPGSIGRRSVSMRWIAFDHTKVSAF